MTKSNKKIVKNYFILALIFLAVILLVWYICKWYTVCNDYKKEIPVIRGTLNYEITESDFEHYILENPSSVVYMCTASEEKCRDFERDFKNTMVSLPVNKKGMPDFELMENFIKQIEKENNSLLKMIRKVK